MDTPSVPDRHRMKMKKKKEKKILAADKWRNNKIITIFPAIGARILTDQTNSSESRPEK